MRYMKFKNTCSCSLLPTFRALKIGPHAIVTWKFDTSNAKHKYRRIVLDILLFLHKDTNITIAVHF